MSPTWDYKNEQPFHFMWDIRKDQSILPTITCGIHSLSHSIVEGVAAHSYSNR
jgi:hypothetical protein